MAQRPVDADDAWILLAGERLDERRVRLILHRFGPEAVRLGREIADAWRAAAPDRPVDGRVFSVRTRLGPHGFTRHPAHAGMQIGQVWRRRPSGVPEIAALVLKWGTGAVVAAK